MAVDQEVDLRHCSCAGPAEANPCHSISAMAMQVKHIVRRVATLAAFLSVCWCSFACKKNAPPPPHFDPSKSLLFEKISPRMTSAEVKAILGVPDLTKENPETNSEAWIYHLRLNEIRSGSDIRGLCVIIKDGQVAQTIPITGSEQVR